MSTWEKIVLTLLTAALAWPWLKKLFTWKSALILVLGGISLWQIFKA
ncbi:hypothetical protein [Pseudomonas chlororaphis]|nr:hypothetical protein [Pseudomonas chlororaphis]